MKYLKTFEEKEEKPQGDIYTKLHYCRKCDEITKHFDGKCLKCKKKREQLNNRKKYWG